MREILFRGKRINNGEWIEGFLFHKYFADIPHDRLVIQYEPKPNVYNWTPPYMAEEIIPETLGQYTGLKDKNGKKIFEGDILDCGDRVVFVKWHDYCGTWDCDFIKYKGEQCSNGVTPAEWKYRAVIIGNIHDNPELLKGGAE